MENKNGITSLKHLLNWVMHLNKKCQRESPAWSAWSTKYQSICLEIPHQKKKNKNSELLHLPSSLSIRPCVSEQSHIYSHSILRYLSTRHLLPYIFIFHLNNE